MQYSVKDILEMEVAPALGCTDPVAIALGAAADARMAGVNLPAMASAGSGNHGLTAVLPIRERRVGSKTTVTGSSKIDLQEESQFIGVRGSLFLTGRL